jgi:hypothetical protein
MPMHGSGLVVAWPQICTRDHCVPVLEGGDITLTKAQQTLLFHGAILAA